MDYEKNGFHGFSKTLPVGNCHYGEQKTDWGTNAKAGDQKDNGEFTQFACERKRYDNGIFYSNANEHALGFRHRNYYHGDYDQICHDNDCGDYT